MRALYDPLHTHTHAENNRVESMYESHREGRRGMREKRGERHVNTQPFQVQERWSSCMWSSLRGNRKRRHSAALEEMQVNECAAFCLDFYQHSHETWVWIKSEERIQHLFRLWWRLHVASCWIKFEVPEVALKLKHLFIYLTQKNTHENKTSESWSERGHWTKNDSKMFVFVPEILPLWCCPPLVKSSVIRMFPCALPIKERKFQGPPVNETRHVRRVECHHFFDNLPH